MWKNFIKIFKNSPCETRSYFSYIENSFGDNFKVIKKIELLDKINKVNYDLFYQRKNIDMFLYENGTSEIFNMFYHYFDIDWDFLSFQALSIESSLDESYKKEFSSFQKSNLANHLYLDLERLLSTEGNNGQLIFLFFFFMPFVNKKEILFHYKKNRPLISCNGITLESFYMLQFLMKEYERETYMLFCQSYNFNHQLIEDYMESSQTLKGFKKGIKWKEDLPVEKMIALLKDECNFTDFEIFRSKKNKAIYPDIYKVLIEFQTSLLAEKLNQKLQEKSHLYQKLIKL